MMHAPIQMLCCASEQPTFNKTRKQATLCSKCEWKTFPFTYMYSAKHQIFWNQQRSCHGTVNMSSVNIHCVSKKGPGHYRL